MDRVHKFKKYYSYVYCIKVTKERKNGNIILIKSIKNIMWFRIGEYTEFL